MEARSYPGGCCGNAFTYMQQGVTSAVRVEVFSKPSDDFLEDEPVKEEKQMKELVSKCRWLGKAIQELIIQ